MVHFLLHIGEEGQEVWSTHFLKYRVSFYLYLVSVYVHIVLCYHICLTVGGRKMCVLGFLSEGPVSPLRLTLL